MEKLGIAYSITGNYVLKTLPSLVSVLENNRICSEEERVELKIFFYILENNDLQIIELKKVCDEYNVQLEIIDSQQCIEKLEKAGDKKYLGSLVNDVFLAAFDSMDIDYNVLFLESDVVLNYNHTLKELALFDFDGGRKSCASTIELQNCAEIKKVMPLLPNQHVFNCGVMLASPKLYQNHNTFKQYANSIEERGWKFHPYWNVLRNAYGLRNELCILPMRYQVYPAQRMLRIDQWMKIFGMEKENYYSNNEIEEAIRDPIFIHYVNFIVKKPWIRDWPKKYKKEGSWPFQDVWNYYAELLELRNELMEDWNKTFLEKVKRFLYNYNTTIYVWLCSFFYSREVKSRNKRIYSFSENDKNLYFTNR